MAASKKWAHFCEGQLYSARTKILWIVYPGTAERFQAAMQERLAKFGLTLNATKARLIEFGWFAAENRKRGGQRKPETFYFPGFTHCCSTDKDDSKSSG
jgi:hypothetical protein